MTPIEPGRELDALMAEKVMRLCVHEWEVVGDGHPHAMPGDWIAVCDRCGRERSGGYRMLPPVSGLTKNYSTDIAAAMEALEKIRATKDDTHSYLFKIESCEACIYADPPESGKWLVTITRLYDKPYISDVYYGSAATLPHAICLAALRAVGYDAD